MTSSTQSSPPTVSDESYQFHQLPRCLEVQLRARQGKVEQSPRVRTSAHVTSVVVLLSLAHRQPSVHVEPRLGDTRVGRGRSQVDNVCAAGEKNRPSDRSGSFISSLEFSPRHHAHRRAHHHHSTCHPQTPGPKPTPHDRRTHHDLLSPFPKENARTPQRMQQRNETGGSITLWPALDNPPLFTSFFPSSSPP